MKVALVGNPNSGKTSLFNGLTRLNQKVGNYPGITVDKKTGAAKLPNNTVANIIDLPGAYSLYPKSVDEGVVNQILCDPNNPHHPDVIVIVADASNLKRNLLFCSQIIDLNIPVIIALNMVDLARNKDLHVDTAKLSQQLGVQVIPINARKNQGIRRIKNALSKLSTPPRQSTVRDNKHLINIKKLAPHVIESIKPIINSRSDYNSFLTANNIENITYLGKQDKEAIKDILKEKDFNSPQLQAQETIERYQKINKILNNSIVQPTPTISSGHDFSRGLDKVLMHPIWGYMSFIVIMLLIFQTIFSWASYPMDLIDMGISSLSQWLADTLPKGMLSGLLIDGVIAGLGGIVIFIPQIMILFAFVAMLEDTGYMARVSFMMDKLMRNVGLNGRSVVPLMSGFACAVPAIMAARNIVNWKERLITIMVIPLMSCSARLPVYTILIALVVPDQSILGVFNLKGLALLFLYLLGFFAAISVAWVMKYIIKTNEKSHFVMELPIYKSPRWTNVLTTMFEKAKVFVFSAGKVIIVISMILWFLASFAPGEKFEQIEKKYAAKEYDQKYSQQEIANHIQAEKLENSYVGIIGKIIEPAILPLGYNWEIGIALITSFAAREVFVGTMATIYSIESGQENIVSLKNRMAAVINPQTGKPLYNFATAFSLMIFYAFAMQCMSTVAVVRRETKGWKWAIIQIIYMTLLAYFASLFTYQLLK